MSQQTETSEARKQLEALSYEELLGPDLMKVLRARAREGIEVWRDEVSMAAGHLAWSGEDAPPVEPAAEGAGFE
jgi:hypothetical protein